MEVLNYIALYVTLCILVLYAVVLFKRGIRAYRKTYDEVEYNDYSEFLKNDAVLNFVSDRRKNFATPTNEEDIVNIAVLFSKDTNYNKVIKKQITQ